MKALISGITGQDGSYLAESLLKSGYEVHGIIRRSSSFNTARIDHIFDDLKLHYGDVTDGGRVSQLVAAIQPDEIYHLAAMSHVRVSFDCPAHSVDSVVQGTLNMLEAVRHHAPDARLYNASSSEMFGAVLETPQRETTPFNPASPYSCAKACAHYLTKNYREAYGLHASSGILFNHESPRRGETFVTRKITKAVARIKAGKQKELFLGNLSAKRDWGHARDFVEGMRLIVGHDSPSDYVLATGETHTVQSFVERAFAIAGLKWQDHVRFDERLLRPTEVDLLLGDPSKAGAVLGWRNVTSFQDLVEDMVFSDLIAEGLNVEHYQ